MLTEKNHGSECACIACMRRVPTIPRAIRYSGAWDGQRFKGVYVTIWAGLELDRFGFAAEGKPAPVDMSYAIAKEAEQAARRKISVYGASSL